MKSVLKAKTASILLILVSIDFIYSGCCCKKKGNNGGDGHRSSRGTNLTGSQGDKGDPIKTKVKSETPGGSHTTKTVPIKPDPSKVVTHKATEADIKEITDALAEYMNKRDGVNRKDIIKVWTSGTDRNGDYYVKYECFSGTIIDNDELIISKIKSGKICELQVKLFLTLSGCGCGYYTFNKDICTLSDLVKSLNKLDKGFRYNKDEHLCVIDSSKTFTSARYINLTNGIMYDIYQKVYISRGGKNGNFFRMCSNPLYNKEDGKFYIKLGDKFELGEEIECAGDFNKKIYNENDIDNFKLLLNV